VAALVKKRKNFAPAENFVGAGKLSFATRSASANGSNFLSVKYYTVRPAFDWHSFSARFGELDEGDVEAVQGNFRARLCKRTDVVGH